MTSNEITEKTRFPLSLIIVLGGSAFSIVLALFGLYLTQVSIQKDTTNAIGLVAKDVGEIKAQVAEVKAALVNNVTVGELQMWIRLVNAQYPDRPLPDFRKL